MEIHPALDCFGITAGDGMRKSSDENTTWTYNAIGKAIKEYLIENSNRKFNLIHSSGYSNPELFDSIYLALKTVPNAKLNFSFKYAQAHMYSTTTPKWRAAIESAKKLSIKTWLTMRNDDYYYINWGDPQFACDYMACIPNKKDAVAMNSGSDLYNPSRTYFYKHEVLNGQLEVERQWYMEMLWGRISYNPNIGDDVFKNMLAKRFPTVSAKNLFQAWTLSSRTLPKVT